MTEFLIDNILDQDFRRMLFPLNLMLSVFLQSKFRILHGFVTPNSFGVNVLCFFGGFLVILIHICRYTTFNNFHDISTDLNFNISTSMCFDTLFYGIFALIVCLVNITQNKHNVELILKIQKSYRMFNHDAKKMKRFQYINWLHVISMVVLYCLHVIYGYFSFVNRSLIDDVVLFSLDYFDVNIVFAIRIIKFLQYELKLWKMEVDMFLTTCSKKGQLKTNCNDINLRREKTYLSDPTLQGEKLFTVYRDILKAFELCETIFTASIIYLSMELFFHPLLAFNFFIKINAETSFVNHDRFYGIHVIITMTSWIMKNFLLLVYVCVTYQEFYLAVVDVDVAGALILSNTCPADVRRLCKKVLRLNEHTRAARELRPGGVLAVDATLPLRLLALLATYTVVLLQFSFL